MSACDEIREILWPLDRPRGIVEGEAEARAHLASCASCRAFFERDAMISRVLKAHDLAVPAPEPMRERLEGVLANEVGRSLQRSRRWATATRGLPLLAAAAIAGLLFGVSRTSPGMEGEYARDFLSRAVEADVVEQPDEQAVAAFFMRELGLPVAPVLLAESPVSRAMICLIDGKRAALVEYAIEGYTLAHYRVPQSDGRIPGVGAPSIAEENGVCVYRWADERFEHALVSDMPEDRLIAVARANFTTSP